MSSVRTCSRENECRDAHTCRAGFPDPFAVATINGEQTRTTSVIKKTLNPYWNESFDMYVPPTPACTTTLLIPARRVNEESVLAVQIFDQKKFKKKDQGFLGVINVRIGSVIDLDAGGDGTLSCLSCPAMVLTHCRNAHPRS